MLKVRKNNTSKECYYKTWAEYVRNVKPQFSNIKEEIVLFNDLIVYGQVIIFDHIIETQNHSLTDLIKDYNFIKNQIKR